MAVTVNSQQVAVDATTSTSSAITPTGIVAGRSLILIIGDAGGGSTGTVTGVTDTGGNTWTLPSPPNGGVAGVTNTKMAVAYVHNCVAPGTITVAHGSIANTKLLLLECTGLANTPHNVANQDITAAASLTNVAPSVTASAGPWWALAFVNRNGTANPTSITAGWIGNTAGQPDLTAPILRAAWQGFASAGASGNCGFTFSTSVQAGLGMIGFLQTGAVVPSARQLALSGVGT